MKTEKKYTISASLKVGGLSEKKAMAAIFHNERLGWVRSETNKEKNCYKFVDGKLITLKKDDESRKNRRVDSYAFLQKKIEALHKYNSKRIDLDPSNYDEKNKRNRKYSQFKHNVVSEIIIHVGKGGTNNLREKGATKIAMQNVKAWQKEMGLHEMFFSAVIHADEKGEDHIHILIPASDRNTGKKRKMLKPELSKLQDMIWKDVPGFERGANWDLEPNKKKKKLTPFEYEAEQERLKSVESKLAAKVAEYEGLKIENEQLRKSNEELKIEAKRVLEDEREKLDAVLDGDMGNYIADIVLKRIDDSEHMVKDKDGDMSFIEKLYKIKAFIVDWKEVEFRDDQRKAKFIKQLNQLDRVDKAIARIKPKTRGM
jgi:hypothetical protein